MEEGFIFKGNGPVQEIEVFTTPSGKEIITIICEFGGPYPQFVPIRVFGALTELAKNLKKGTQVKVTGRLEGRRWKDRVFGDNVAETLEIIENS